MREIKFRAWDRKSKMWLEKFNVDLLNIGSLDTIELCQYTGMKDTNGKEIYEGDIVLWIDSKENKRQNKVFFLEGAFRLRNIYFELLEYGILEVIGNIYENPELLDKGAIKE